MLRTFPVVLCSVTMLILACKKADKPAGTTPDQVASTAAGATPSVPADPAKPVDPVAKPAEPAATPANPVGSAKPADPAPGSTTASRELEVKGIAMSQRMADLFVADAKNCEKMATDIRAFTTLNKALLDQLAEMEKHQTQEEREAFDQRNRATLEALLIKVTPAMTACRDNKSVEAAMAAMGPSER
jgi:hypothetical protein